MIVVTGATGKLGRHVIEGLLEKMPASEIIAAVRNPEKASDYAAQGIQVRHADYSQPQTLATAFAGADKLLLISSNEVGQRVAQQKAVIDAAKTAGVKLLAYTSILHADKSTLILAQEHKATEEYLRESGVPYVFLRNGWYLENQTEQLAPALQHGAIVGAGGDGRFAAAARKDYADAAVAALTTPSQENKIYELAGDNPYTYTELAAEVSKQSGKQIAYRNLPEQAYAEMLTGFGLPAPLAEILADADSGAAKGELDDATHTLSKLIGHSTMPLSEAVAAGLKS